MFNLILHTLLLVAASYIIGCIVGWLLHWMFAGSSGTSSGNAAVAAVPVAAAVAAKPTPAPAAPGLPVLRPYTLKAQSAGGFVLLDGAVPTEQIRTDLVGQAARLFPGRTVRNRLTLAGGAPLGFAAATVHGLEQLARLRCGMVQFTDTTMRVTGEAANAETRRSIISTAPPSGYKIESAIGIAPPDAPAIDYSRSVAFADKTIVQPVAKAQSTVATVAEVSATAAPVASVPVAAAVASAATSAGASQPVAAVSAGPAEPTVVLPVPRSSAIQPYRLVAEHDGSTVTLHGHVPSDAARAEALGAAQAAAPESRVVDRLFVGEGAPASHVEGVPYSLGLMAHLSSGRVLLEDGRLSVSGLAKSGSDLIDLRAKTRALPSGLTLQGLSASQAFGAGGGSVTATQVGPPSTGATPTAFTAAASIAASAVTPAALDTGITSAGSMPVPRPYRAEITRFGRTVMLVGHVASEADRAALVDDVRARIPSSDVVDRLHVAPGAPSGHHVALSSGVAALASLTSGSVYVDDGTLSVQGETETALAAMDARAALKAAGPAGVSVRSVAISQGFGAAAPMTATGVVVETAPMPLIEAGAGVVAAGSALGTGLAGATGGTSLDDEPVPVIQPAGEAAAASAAAADAVGDRPRGLVAARDGRADDLKRIKGIGPQNEARLNALGIWHFDQIAAWTPANSRWVGAFLAFPGRIEREHWLDQAAVLATGGMTEFAKRVDKGDLHYGAVDRAEQTRIIAEMRHDIETGVKPVGLPAPRGGQGDDLTAITGIGPAIAKLLNEAGIWHFDQLATLTPAEVHWIEHFVGYPGRAEREGWIEEAKDYAGMS